MMESKVTCKSDERVRENVVWFGCRQSHTHSAYGQ